MPDRDLPTVSVLLITRDRRALLADALKSIEGLHYPRERLQVMVLEDTLEDTNDSRPPRGVAYISRPPELWAVPGIRFVCDLGMDCGRARALLGRILGGART